MSARTFAELRKTLTVNAVHTPTALGNEPRRRARSFKAFIGEPPIAKRYGSVEDLPADVRQKFKDEPKKLRQWMHVFNGELDSHGDESRAFGSAWSAVEKRMLQRHDDETVKTPFLYDVNSLASLRPDQVPRFFGTLTDSEKLDDAKVKLSDLHAMQDRVDPKKVEHFQKNPTGKKPVVVRFNDRNYIADGHHRLAADWLNGEEESDVKFKDLSEISNAMKQRFKVAKVDESQGIVFGWAIVCKQDGKDYYDWNIDHIGKHKGELVPEHITEDAMLKASAGFMETYERPGNEQHAGDDKGTYVFAFPLTSDIAKAMGIESRIHGLMVGYKPPRDVLAKFADGTYTGFSIEGLRVPGGIVEHD